MSTVHTENESKRHREDRRLRFALISHDFYPIQGGLGRHVTELLGAMRSHSKKFEFHGWSPNKNRLPGHQQVLGWTKYLPCDQLVFSFALQCALGRLIRRYSVDGLILNAGPGGVFCLKKPQKPLWVIANHTYKQQSTLKGQEWKKIFIPLEKRSYTIAERILSISSTTKDSLIQDYGIASEKISIIPPGHAFHSSAESPPEASARDVLYIGRLEARKGVHFLLDAFVTALSSMPEVHLHIVGKGSERESLMQKVRSNGVADRVTVHGFLSDEEIARLRTQCFVQVIPSQLEGFGIAAVEAIAAGTPVIATATAGLTDIIESDSTGLLVPFGDCEALAQRIQLASQNKAMMRTLAEKALERSRQKFSWAHIVQQYDSLA